MMQSSGNKVAVAAPQPSPLLPGDLVDEREAALILGVSVQTLRNWRTLGPGNGPSWKKLGKRLVRYRRADLEAFVADGDV